MIFQVQNTNRFFKIPALVVGLAVSIVLVFALGMFSRDPAQAANPSIISFQGKVVNADGTNVTNGSYNFDFVMYSHVTNGTPSDGVYDKWHELSKSVTVTNGVFQTNLGSATALPDFNANPALFLAVRFNADAAGYMTPRVEIASVPYALNSDKLGGFSASQLGQLASNNTWTGTNTLTPTANSAVALTVNGTSGTAATALAVSQAGAAAAITVASASNTATNGLSFSGTFTNLISAPNLTVSNGGAITASGNLAIDTNVLFVDTSADKVGIGTAAPTHALTFATGSSGLAMYNTSDQTTNYERTVGQWTGNTYEFGTAFGGSGTQARNLVIGVGTVAGSTPTNGRALTFSSNAPFYSFSSTTALTGNLTQFSGTLSASSGTQTIYAVVPTINQSSTAGYTAFHINPSITTTGSGAKNLLNVQLGGANRFLVDSGGNVGLGTATFGTSAAGVLALAQSTAPASSPADLVQLYVTDVGAGDARLRVRMEGGGIVTFPNETGTICTTGNVCTGYQAAPATGSYLLQVPTSTADNTVTPTSNSTVGLTINGTSGTAATALSVVQAGAATGLAIGSSSTGNGASISLTNGSGTQAAGLAIDHNGAGTTTSLLNLSNTSGTVTEAIKISGTYTNQITGTSFFVTNGGTVGAGAGFQVTTNSNTAGSYIKYAVAGTGGVAANDAVILTTDGGNTRVMTTTTARDTKVYGVAITSQSSGANVGLVILGNTQVTATSGAVAIGDQLVTSTSAGQVSVDNNATSGILGIATTAKAGGSTGLVGVAVGAVRGQVNPDFGAGNLTTTGTLSVGAISAPTTVNTINGLVINSGSLSSIAGLTQTTGAFAFSGGGNFSIDSAGLDVSTAGVVTLPGAQTADIKTADAATSTAITVQGGTSSGASSNGPALNLKGGDGSGTTTVVGGAVVVRGGAATGGSGTRTGGGVTIDAGTGATSNGSISIGTVNSSASIVIGHSSGAGTINLGLSTASNTINVGNANSTGTQAINIGAGTPSGAGVTNISIGNIVNGGTLSLKAGTGSILMAGAATGTSATYLGLPVKTDSGDPTTTQINGAIYYNSNTSKFRCYEASTWKDCIGSSGSGDSITVNTTVATDANFLNTAASASVAGTTFAINTTSNPDDITLTVSAATGSLAGVVINGAQTFGGAKTFSSALIAPTSTDTINGLVINTGSLSSIAGFTQTTGAFAFSGGGNFSLDSAGLDVTTGGAVSGVSTLTLNGAQTADITTAAASTSTAITIQGGTSSGASSNGPALNLKGGDASGTTSVTGGALTLQGGSATGGSGTRNGGSINIDAGTGASTNGSILIGTTVSSAALTFGTTSQTGIITLGQSTASNTINIGNAVTAGAGTQTINIGAASSATGSAIISIGGDTNSSGVTIKGSSGGVNLNTGTTNGAVSIGSTTQNGIIRLGQSTVTNTISIGSANGSSATQTIDIGAGTSTTSGGKAINIGTGIPGSSTTNTIAIGSGGTTTGTVGVTIGSNGAAAHTTVIQGGNGSGGGSEAIRLSTQSSGAISIAAGTGSIKLSGTATGTSATFLGVPVKTDSGDPTTTQINGAMYYNSNSSKFRCYEASAWKDCDTGGSATTLQQAYTASAGANPSITLTNSFGGIKIRDGGTPVSGDLFSVHNNGGTATYLGISSSAFTIQNSSASTALSLDISTKTLKVYGAAASGFASISYNDGTTTAVFAASTGTTQIGTGAGGGGNINFILSNATDVFEANKTVVLGANYGGLNDYSFRRTLSGAYTADGNVVKIEDLSSATTSSPTLLYINQNNTSATGNLILAQTGGSTTRLQVTTAGNLTTAGTATIQGAGTNAFTGAIDTASTIQAGSSNVNLTLATGFIDADALTLVSATNGLSGTSSASGLAVYSDGLSLLQGCNDAEGLVWTESSDTWGCASLAANLQTAYAASGTPATITTTSASKGIVFQSGSGFDSASLFKALNAAGSSIFNVNTTNLPGIEIGSLAQRADIDVYGDVIKEDLKKQTGLANINDIFVYDTTTDSNQGAWRNSPTAQQLSWYTETKDDGANDACVVASDDRCGESRFPRKAIIAATIDGVYIFDQKNGMLWMKFTQGGTFALGADSNNNPSGIFAINGVLYISTNGSSGSGIYAFDFVTDRMYRINTTNRSQGDKNIANRNTTVAYSTDSNTRYAIADNIVNDINGVVVQGSLAANPMNGSILIAAATDTALSVINLNRATVINYSDVTSDDYNAVQITKRGYLYALNETQGQLERWNAVDGDITSETNGVPDRVWDETGGIDAGTARTFGAALTGTAPTIGISSDTIEVTERGSWSDDASDIIYVGTNKGLSVIHSNVTNEGNGWVKNYTKDYITDEMYGGVRAMIPFHNTSGDITDVSYKGNVFDVKGSPAYASADGVRGTSMIFDNTNDLICSDTNNDAACDADTDFDAGTAGANTGWYVSAWFKHTVTAPASGVDMLVDRASTTAGAAAIGWSVWMNTSGNIVAGFDDDTTQTNSIPTDTTATSPGTYNDDQWHHVFVSQISATDRRLFIDGRQVANTVVSETAMSGTANTVLTIGADCAGTACGTSTSFWDGKIDDVVIGMDNGLLAASTYLSTPASVQRLVRRSFLEGNAALQRRTVNVTDATTTSSTTIGDSGEAWIPNELVGSFVEITGGTGAGQTRRIISNTTTTMTVSPAWTSTPDTTSDFQANPEEIYGATDTVTGIGIQDTFIGEHRKLYIGTSDGSDGGGVTVFNNVGANFVTDLYHAGAKKTDDLSAEWTGTDYDDIEAISDTNGVLVMGSLASLWIENEGTTLSKVDDLLGSYIGAIRLELRADGLTALTPEQGYVPGADLAELYSSTEQLQPGEVVAVDPSSSTSVVKSTKPYQGNQLGIVATQPGLILGQGTPDSYPVALVGRVPVKVTTENGIIKNGDRITSSSKPGFAMKATLGGRVLGVALEDMNIETLVDCGPEGNEASMQCGEVLVFVNLTDYSGISVESLMEDPGMNEALYSDLMFEGFAFDDTTVDTGRQEKILNILNTLKQQTNEFKTDGSEILTGRVSAVNEIISPLIVTSLLRADRIEANSIEGLEIFVDKISARPKANEVPAGLDEQTHSATTSAVLSSLELDKVQGVQIVALAGIESRGGLVVDGESQFNGKTTFASIAEFLGVTTFKGDTNFEQHTTFGSDNGGKIIVKKDSKKVNVVFDKEYSGSPLISVNFIADDTKDADGNITDSAEAKQERYVTAGYGYAIVNLTKKGFTLILNKPATEDISFNWLALAVKDVKISESSPEDIIKPEVSNAQN